MKIKAKSFLKNKRGINAYRVCFRFGRPDPSSHPRIPDNRPRPVVETIVNASSISNAFKMVSIDMPGVELLEISKVGEAWEKTEADYSL